VDLIYTFGNLIFLITALGSVNHASFQPLEDLIGWALLFLPGVRRNWPQPQELGHNVVVPFCHYFFLYGFNGTWNSGT
jgi:hypothetical protein